MGHHPNLPFPTADPKVELRSPPSKYLAAAIVIVHGPTSPSSSAGGLAVPAAPCRGGCSSPWPVFAMPAAPRRGSASPSSSAGPPGSAGHGGARPRPGHGGARPPLSRRLGPRRGSGRGAAAPLGANLGLRRRPARVLGGGAPQEDEPAARSRVRTRRLATQGRGRWGGADLEAGCPRKVAHGAAGGSGTRSGRRRSRVGEKKERGEGDGADKWAQCHMAFTSTKSATKTV